MKPYATALQRTPAGPHSLATVFVSPTTAILPAGKRRPIYMAKETDYTRKETYCVVIEAHYTLKEWQKRPNIWRN